MAAAGTLIVMACGGSPAAEPVSPEPTPPAADTAAPPPEPPSPPPEPESPEAEPEGAPRQSEDPAAEPESPPPASEDPPAEPPLAFDVDRDTVWEDVFDALTAAEQTCISGELDDDLLRSVLERRVLSESGSEQWEASIFGCLTPDNARSLFLGAVIEGFREDLGVGDLSGEEMSCLRDWVANIDVAALVAADVSGADDAEFVEPMMGVMGCVAVPFLAALFADMGVDMEDLSEDELSCLRQWQSDLADADWAALASGGDGIAALGLLGLGPMGCIPDRFVAVVLADMGVDTEDLSEDELSCLQQWLSDLADVDWASLDEVDAAFGEIVLGLSACLPELGLPDLDPQPDGPDDHADSIEGATAVIVGQPVAGSMDYFGDVDVFTFEAVAGERYRIEVTLGSLGDSVVSLYDADGWELAFNDDHGDSLASLITWVAPESGSYYVAVEAVDLAVAPPDDPATESGSDDLEVGGLGDPGAGSYTLSVTAS